MPRVPLPGPYRVAFYSFDCAEPAHVHVQRERAVAKFWMAPVRLASNHGFRLAELHRIERLLRESQSEILHHWNEHCRQDPS